MWGRKEDENPSPASPAAAAKPRPEPAPAPPPRPAASAPPAPKPAPAPNGRGQAVVSKSLKIKGTVTGHEDLYIDGEIEGAVELEDNSVTIGPNGNVNADVKARDITVLGKLNGNVRAGERVEIRKTGSLQGDLVTSRVVIEDGAVFRGSVDIAKAEGQAPLARKPAAVAAEASGKGGA